MMRLIAVWFRGRKNFSSLFSDFLAGWNGSSGSGFSVPRRFLCKKGFSVFQYSLTGKDGSGFGSWKTVPAGPVRRSVPAKTVPAVPVSGSGSVPGPLCFWFIVRPISGMRPVVVLFWVFSFVLQAFGLLWARLEPKLTIGPFRPPKP